VNFVDEFLGKFFAVFSTRFPLFGRFFFPKLFLIPQLLVIPLFFGLHGFRGGSSLSSTGWPTLGMEVFSLLQDYHLFIYLFLLSKHVLLG